MQEIFTNKLHQYISENNPDLLIALEENNETSSFLNHKVQGIDDLLTELKNRSNPEYIIEEVCMGGLTKDLQPSKYNYIKNTLEEEFEYAFYNFQKSGVLLYEIINIINYAKDIFKDFDFTGESDDSSFLRYAVIGIISEYLSK